jgi:hypothetical protein
MRLLPALLAAALSLGCTATTTSSPTSTPRASATAAAVSVPAEASDGPSAAPSSAAELPRITWTEVPFEGEVSTVIGDGTRFVAVGVGADGTAAWTSTDGMTWEEHSVPDLAVAEPNPGTTVDARMGTLVRLGDTLYSFGGNSFIDTVFLVGWYWTDGGAWELVESESGFYDGGSLWALGASDEALVAARVLPYAGGASTWRWMSDTSWLQSGLSSTPDESVWVADFAWVDGTHVAVGHTAEADPDENPSEWPRTVAVWTSSDGLVWSTATAPDGADGFCAVTALADGGFVALGSAGGAPAAWTSADGISWTEGSVEAPGTELPLLASPENPCQVITVDDGLLAAVGIPGGSMVSWTSTDGRAWSVGEPLAANGAIASLGDQLVLVGGVPDPESPTGVRQVVLHGTVEP